MLDQVLHRALWVPMESSAKGICPILRNASEQEHSFLLRNNRVETFLLMRATEESFSSEERRTRRLFFFFLNHETAGFHCKPKFGASWSLCNRFSRVSVSSAVSQDSGEIGEGGWGYFRFIDGEMRPENGQELA